MTSQVVAGSTMAKVLASKVHISQQGERFILLRSAGGWLILETEYRAELISAIASLGDGHE